MHVLRTFPLSSGRGLYDGTLNAMTALDEVAGACVDFHLAHRAVDREGIMAALAGRFAPEALTAALDELTAMGLFLPLPTPSRPPSPGMLPGGGGDAEGRPDLPLQTLVLHTAQGCNLACTYCYADEGLYGGGRQMLSVETASQALDFLIATGGRKLHVTFFGGEPLLNWKVMKHTILDGLSKVAATGQKLDFSFTTNATLLTPEIVDFLSLHDVGVSVSMDGPPEQHDANRPFHGGKGSFAAIAPKVQLLLQRHRTRPIGARVTLSRGQTNVEEIFDFLSGMGFAEVGFAPVTSGDPKVQMSDEDMVALLEGFARLGERTVESALQGRFLGFSNLVNLWQELHAGRRKTYACGAGIGMLSVGVDGRIALCHRFNGIPEYQFGDLESGIDTERLAGFLAKVHVQERGHCRECFAQSLCSGGCYHEAYTRQGDATLPTAHFCSYIQSWIDLALATYARLWEANPAFFDQLSPRAPKTGVWPGGE